MHYILIEGNTQTSSFRIPENHTVHPTLPLPSPTNIIGLIGAVKGLKYEDAQEYVLNNGVHMGIYGQSSGYAMDFWKTEVYVKGVPYPVKREINFFNKYTIVLGSESEETVNELHRAFHNPVYITVMGNSDDLFNISKAENMVKNDNYVEEEHDTFESTVVLGDYLQKLTLNLEKYKHQNGERYVKVTPPRRFKLPTVFNFRDDVRTASKKETLTYINSVMSFEEKINSIKLVNHPSLNDVHIPVFKISGD